MVIQIYRTILSYEFVKTTLDLSKLEDIKNDTCPVMGGEVEADVFAIYQNKKVSFCCAGCDREFFADPKGHFQKLGHVL